ncbi:MAG: hypothetical protein ABI851_07420 [Saprospiraceae bacterium]
MKAIIRFAITFVISYGLCLFMFQTNLLSGIINRFNKAVCTSWISTTLPSADISTQDINDKTKSASDIYLVYGNPLLIQKAKEEARQSKQAYATLPTKSMELHLFEMFVVPLFFILSLFVATPIAWKEKLKGLVISFVLLYAVILLKLLMLSLFEISNSRIGVYELGDSSMNLLSKVLGIFTLGLSLSLAFILWLIFGFRKSSFVDHFKLLLGNK